MGCEMEKVRVFDDGLLPFLFSDNVDEAPQVVNLTIYAYNKATEVSEKEHGCDLKTKFLNSKRKIGYGSEKGLLTFLKRAGNFNGNTRLVMENRNAEGPNNFSFFGIKNIMDLK
jgi:hypothetical protein